MDGFSIILLATAIPEPSNWALFALGVAGVLIGRFGVRSRPSDDD